jgi:hypothetical protein
VVNGKRNAFVEKQNERDEEGKQKWLYPWREREPNECKLQRKSREGSGRRFGKFSKVGQVNACMRRKTKLVATLEKKTKVGM